MERDGVGQREGTLYAMLKCLVLCDIYESRWILRKEVTWFGLYFRMAPLEAVLRMYWRGLKTRWSRKMTLWKKRLGWLESQNRERDGYIDTFVCSIFLGTSWGLCFFLLYNQNLQLFPNLETIFPKANPFFILCAGLLNKLEQNFSMSSSFWDVRTSIWPCMPFSRVFGGELGRS